MLLAALLSMAAPQADLVSHLHLSQRTHSHTSPWLTVPRKIRILLPGFEAFEPWPFKIYSGYLTVPGPFKLNKYDSLHIHYQLHTAQKSPARAPVVTWHQGGPGGSSIAVGLYTEMGFLQIDDQGMHTNEYAWNKIANMLYLESPAGSGDSHGFSTCVQGSQPTSCEWDDVSQAEAYAHTLAAFYRAFPEYSSNPLYLTGESYFGQYGPNIAQWILTHAPFNVSFPLKGIALGNACWGGDEHSVNCNGPNEEQNDVDMFFGKGLISKKLHERVYKGCRFPLKAPPTGECESLLEEVHSAVGPHNVYNIYDDCAGSVQPKLTESGRSMRWLTKHLREPLSSSTEPSSAQIDRRKLADGGYTWACGGEDATSKWLLRPDVRAALHLGSPAESSFKYTTSGPASITLYPHLITRLRVLIYNGDADACVPYKGNEEWIDSLVEAGDLTENSAWRPWYTSKSHVRTAPAGYVTTYNVSHGKHDFSFLTIRLAGHM
ncbi:MAG: hypothetical protein SGPRY_001002, partial [Prymnesium sp.]